MTPRLPRLGLIYTLNPGPKQDYLEETPSTLPTEDGIEEAFLPVQAEQPLTGRAWGLALRYNCSIVQTASEFGILKFRNDSRLEPILQPPARRVGTYDEPEALASIHMYYLDFTRRNVNVRLAIGSTAGYLPRVRFTQGLPGSGIGYAGNATEAYPGLEVEEVLEFQLWQQLNTTVEGLTMVEGVELPLASDFFNNSIDYPIAGVSAPANLTEANLIGLRCTSSSAVGTAEIDGAYVTYKNFRRTDTATPEGAFSNQKFAPRLSWAMDNVVTGLSTTGGPFEEFDWYAALFSSVERTPPTFPAEFGKGLIGKLQQSYLQAEELRRSVLRAYATYALQLIYD